jgi:hypothetical protein
MAHQARLGIRGPRHGRHRRDGRPRPSVLLLDPPSATGLPPYRMSALPRARATRLIPTAAVALTLAAATGIAVAQGFGGTSSGGMGSAGTGNGPGPGLTPATLPSATASGTSPGSAGAPQASQPTHAPAPSGSVTRPPSTRGTPSSSTPSPAAPSATALPATAPTTVPPTTGRPTSRPAITVRYHVVSQWDRGFKGEVAVVNNGRSPISDWQIVVALPGDQFTAVSANASGYASNHILLLHPASSANQVPANGILRVFFTTYGAELAPELCAFNDTACG